MAISYQNIFSLLFFIFVTSSAMAQIRGTNTNFVGRTEFEDDFYIFCAERGSESKGGLIADSPIGNATFYWEKYDTISNSFADINGAYSISGDTLYSQIRGLDNGCYRVTISAIENGASIVEKVWVLNNWIEVTFIEIPDSSSTCESFKIETEFESAPLFVFNTTNGNKSDLRKIYNKFDYRWTQSGENVTSELSPIIYQPIASDSPVPYQIEISDELGCIGLGEVDYHSKVTKADFEYDPSEGGEAVLEVTFNNNSINYDSAQWFFYKDRFRTGLEIADANGEVVDSLWFTLYDDEPIFEFEASGDYPIKLVTVKVNDTGNCYSTIYGKDVEVFESLVEIGNVFTPNGDGVNDVFVIKSQSLESLNVRIFNGWGGLVHSWNYSNIRSKDYTYEHSVWDGRIGTRMASPGVYYYVVTYEGRDIWTENATEEEQTIVRDRIGKVKKETLTGFVHLFRDKN